MVTHLYLQFMHTNIPTPTIYTRKQNNSFSYNSLQIATFNGMKSCQLRGAESFSGPKQNKQREEAWGKGGYVGSLEQT